MVKKVFATVGAISMNFLPIHVHAQVREPLQFSATRIHIDHTVAPGTIIDVSRECMANSTCSQAVKAAAASYGIDQRYVTAASVALENQQRGTEERRVNFRYPPGYTFCRVMNVNQISATSHTAMSGTATRHGYGFYTFAQQGNIGEGKRWTEATVDLLFIREDQHYRGQNTGRCAKINYEGEDKYRWRVEPDEYRIRIMKCTDRSCNDAAINQTELIPVRDRK